MKDFGFKLYLLFVISWFLHISERISVLGLIRLDFSLVLILTILCMLGKKESEEKFEKHTRTETVLWLLIIFSVVTAPFAQWPGSVLHTGIPNFIKAVVFFYFTINFVTNEKKLKIFMIVFLATQSIRIFEPVFLHITTGYWGSSAYAGGEYMNRLAGAPDDIVNPNGLAFVILTALPFFYFFSKLSWKCKMVMLFITPVFLYGLILTSSRSGMAGFIAILVGIIFKSKRKFLLIGIFICCGFILFLSLSPDHQDRYLSVIDSKTKNAATAQGRIEGVKSDFEVAFRKPFVGHGLGTSREANANFGAGDQRAHNLYSEIAQEIGFTGVIIFLFFIKSIIINFIKSLKILKAKRKQNKYMIEFNNAMQVWLGMNILFSFTSYGLSGYEWYLFAGLSVTLTKMCLSLDNCSLVRDRREYGRVK